MIALFLALLLAQDPQAADKTWTAKGTVVNALTGEALRKTTVTLAHDQVRFFATTDAEGKFNIEGAGSGEFQVLASRQGFLDFNESHKLKIAGDVKDLALKLTPQCVIAGHIVDEDGDPVGGGTVFVARMIAGREVSSQTTEADADGYFAVHGLAAGRYAVSASRESALETMFGTPRSAPHPPVDYVRTYYPSSLTAAASIPLILEAGVENRSVEIRLRKDRVFHVRGHAKNLPKSYLGFVLIGAAGQQSPGIAAIAEDGKFEFTGVLPGNYLLHNAVLGNEDAMFCRIPVTVGNRDIDDLIVDLVHGSTITASIKMEDAAQPPAHWPQVHFNGAESSHDAEIKQDGTFTWSNVPPDLYKVSLPSAEEVYLKSLHFNGQPASVAGLDLTSSTGGALEIILSSKIAEISGVVRDQDGSPMGKKLVTLWPTGESPRTVTSNANGSFRFGGLPPGEYRVLGWEEIEEARAVTPEFIGQFKAVDVKLQEGAKESLHLKMVAKPAIDEEIAKLP